MLNSNATPDEDALSQQRSSSNGQPLISAIVLAYNQAAFIDAAIESLLSQTIPVQIVVCDDSSSDGTADRARHLLERAGWPHGSKVIANPKNLGTSANLGVAMSHADSELIMFNDGDDISLPDRARKLVEFFDANDVTMIGSSAILIDEEGSSIDGGFYWYVDADKKVDIDQVDEYGRWLVLGATMAFKRTLWDVFGPMEPGTLGPDWALSHRALALDGIGLIKEPLVKYRRVSGSLTNRLAGWSVKRSLLNRKLDEYIRNCEGTLVDLDKVLHKGAAPKSTAKLARIRLNVDLRTSMVSAARDFPSLQSVSRLARMAFSKDIFMRRYAMKCILLVIDPPRHEMWFRLSPKEIFGRLVKKLTRSVTSHHISS